VFNPACKTSLHDRQTRIIMLSLMSGVSGAILELADHENEIHFGINPYTQAVFSATCDLPKVGMNTMYPHSPRIDVGTSDVWSIEKNTPKIVVELMNIPMTCANRRSHIEPCVPHDPEDGDYFKCKFTGAAGEIEMPAQKPYADWIWVQGVRTETVAKINCTTPDTSGIIAATGYDGTLAFQEGAPLTVSIVYAPNATGKVDLEYMGEPGQNVITYHGWPTPPMAPSPPLSPPPPMSPCDGNSLGCSDQWWPMIANWITSDYKRPTNLCWSSERDSMSSNVWHQNCNDKGRTVFFAKVVYSGKTYITGSYQRPTWSGSGYGSDSTAAIFKFSPNPFKSVAGSGPHGGYSYAIYKGNGYGPTYGGGHDWHVSSNMKTGYLNFGHNYKCRVGNYGQNSCRNDILGSYSSWSLSEAEMWSEN